MANMLYTISNSLGRNHRIFAEWHQFVEQNLPGSYGNEWKEYLEVVDQKNQKIPAIPAAERIRTCTTTMKSIIRPGLPQEYTDLLIQRLEKTVMDVTNLESDLVAIIRAQMYEACARCFVVDQGAIHLDSPEHVHRLNIKQLLPERKVRNKDTLVGGEYIPVGPVLADIPMTIATADFTSYLQLNMYKEYLLVTSRQLKNYQCLVHYIHFGKSYVLACLLP